MGRRSVFVYERAIRLIRTQVGMFSLDAILAWLLVVAFHLALATGPACGACVMRSATKGRYGKRGKTRPKKIKKKPNSQRTISDFAMRVDDATCLLWSQLVDGDAFVWFGKLGHGAGDRMRIGRREGRPLIAFNPCCLLARMDQRAMCRPRSIQATSLL